MAKKGEIIVLNKSFVFAIRIVNAVKYLRENKSEYVISKQLLRCGTAIGALIREAEHAESKLDFIHKLNVALKEANETEYWIELLRETDYFRIDESISLYTHCDELISLLISIIKATKLNNNIKNK